MLPMRPSHKEFPRVFNTNPNFQQKRGNGILCTSGLLNGQFGEGQDTHVAYWESGKVVDRTEEEDDSGATVIREKERFSQRLTLLYADGRIALLSERAVGKEAGDAERAPADGEADVRETEPRHDTAGSFFRALPVRGCSARFKGRTGQIGRAPLSTTGLERVWSGLLAWGSGAPLWAPSLGVG